MVPRKWDSPATWKRIAVGWDGGTHAARAVGDALPFLEMAEEVEIACVAPDKAKKIAGDKIATHLSRHCKSVKVTKLTTVDGSVAKALHYHAKGMNADMRVMGAYGHLPFYEMVFGGATMDVFQNADIPVFFSH
jgi:nucleotide-binding universal stress UspA family protein